ncbi:MAG: AAA family ATPase [Alphaproteobacteria bacterium]|jgi:uncharacterized protein YhaN|nr:AAA family ATPase [Alphaproteobacteria bacterium]
MRIQRLGLTRFGKFTDFALDFGPQPSAGPDLHIVYGPNEAGKSTIYAGLLDLFFGIPRMSTFNFKHAPATMQLDGVIETDGEEISLTRIKRQKNDLLDADGQPVGIDPFAVAFGSLDRDAYQAMFSLNEASLSEGGKGLIAAKGDFGRILYGASAGLSGFSETLEAIREEADAFHRPSARRTALSGLKQQLDELIKAKAEADTQAPEYERLQTAQAAAADASAAAQTEEAKCRQTLALLKAQQTTLPHLAEYKDILAKLSAQPSLPDPPADAADRLAKLRDQQTRLTVRDAESVKRMDALEAEIANVQVDESLLALAPRIKALGEAEARFITAESDLPRRKQALGELDDAIAATSARLTGTITSDAQTLLLPPDVRASLSELANAWPALAERLRAAVEEAENATIDSDALILAPKAEAELQAALATARASSAEHRLSETQAKVRSLEAELDVALGALAPWQGDANGLRALNAPNPEDVETLRQTIVERELALSQARANLADAEAIARDATAKSDAAEAHLDGRSSDDLSALMASRDAAWRAHITDLTEATAKTFETKLQATDHAHQLHFANASALAAAAAQREAVSVSNAAAQTAALAVEAAFARLAESNEALSALSSGISAGAECSPRQLSDWLAHRTAALQFDDALRTAYGETDTAHAEISGLRNRLGGVDGDGLTLDGLMRFAEEQLRQSSETRRNADASGKRQAALAEQQAAVEQWRSEWAACIQGTWLAPLNPSAASVRDILEDLTALAADLREQTNLRRRIAEMENDQAAFRQALQSLHDAMDIPLQADAMLDAANTLRSALAAAEQQDTIRQKLQQDIDQTAEARRALDLERKEHELAATKLKSVLTVETLDAASEILAQADQRDRWRADEARLGRLLTDSGAGPAGGDLPEILASLEALDRNTLAMQLAEAETALEAAANESRERHSDLRDASKALEAISGDAEAAYLEEQRQTKLAEITSTAARYLRLRLGVLAADQALEAYRARHQSGMLGHASRAFSTITGGAYSGLTTQAGAKGEDLIALARDGASRLDDDSMSTGTRAQLYLALRVAAYHEFANARTPPPFLADDILETFDEERAARTLGTLSEMATIGQVIYFTHERHLKAIAEEAAPHARWHALPTA